MTPEPVPDSGVVPAPLHPLKIQFPKSMLKRMRAAAKREGLDLSKWIHQAMGAAPKMRAEEAEDVELVSLRLGELEHDAQAAAKAARMPLATWIREACRAALGDER